MTETSENSGLFTGVYRLDPRRRSTEATLEVYLPPQKMAFDGNNIQVVAEMIRDGILLRKPYFYRKERGEQFITIYDSKTEALEAYRYFVRTGQSGKVINPNLLENKARSEIESPSEPKAQDMSTLKNIIEEEKALQKQMSEKAEQQKKLNEEAPGFRSKSRRIRRFKVI
jgi:hypothetical protein